MRHAELVSASLVHEIPGQARNDGMSEIPGQARNDGMSEIPNQVRNDETG